MVLGISTVDSPYSTDVSFNAPNFSLTVQGYDVPLGIRQFIKRIEYESADGLADIMKIMIQDPKTIQPQNMVGVGSITGFSSSGVGKAGSIRIRDTKIFQPGNELSLSIGYGSSLKHIGRVVIRKTRPNYPREEIPTLEVIGYTKDCEMMDNSPKKSKRSSTPARRGGKAKTKEGRIFKETTFADAVRAIALDYDMTAEVDDTEDTPHQFIQKVGLTDYDFVRGLSNITGYFFWVDADSNGDWILHFRNPSQLKKNVFQDKIYIFKYENGNLGSLLDFEPEVVTQGSITKLQVKVKDVRTGNVFEAEFEEENDQSPDIVAEALSGYGASSNELKGNFTTASDMRIFIDDYSFDINTSKRFKTEAEVIAWARQWFRRNRENFILSHGTIIGTETVMARQIHKLEGLGAGLDGEYFFSKVNHIMDSDVGYFMEIGCRKVVPEIA